MQKAQKKHCPRCGLTRALDHFAKHKARPDGRSGWCMDCDREVQAKRRERLRTRRLLKLPLEKHCSRCGLTLPASMFNMTRLQLDGLQSYCKQCASDSQKRLSPADYEAMCESQDGKCAICAVSLTRRRACIDHCHATNKVRAILCGLCNSGLGFFRDEPDRMRRAAEYIEKHRDKKGDHEH